MKARFSTSGHTAVRGRPDQSPTSAPREGNWPGSQGQDAGENPSMNIDRSTSTNGASHWCWTVATVRYASRRSPSYLCVIPMIDTDEPSYGSTSLGRHGRPIDVCAWERDDDRCRSVDRRSL
jgi:hypothetical protein